MSRRWVLCGAVLGALVGCRAILGIADLTVQGDGGSSGDGGESDAIAEAAPPTDSSQGTDSVRADSQPPPDAGGGDSSAPSVCDAACTGLDGESCARADCLNCCIQSAPTSTQRAFFIDGQQGSFSMKSCLCNPPFGACNMAAGGPTPCMNFCAGGMAYENACNDCSVKEILGAMGACHSNECQSTDCQALADCLASCPAN